MKSLKIILICLYLSACQNPQQNKNSQDEASNIQLQSDSLINGNTPNDTVNSLQNTSNPIAYFDKALTYQYEKNSIKHELWFYVNETTQQILYVPEDDMIQAVISYPNGTYIIYATDENGRKIKIKQQIDAVLTNGDFSKLLTALPENNTTISQKNIQQADIKTLGYILHFQKSNESEMLNITSQIPINSYQLYGFSKLDGDAKLPLNLDYTNVVKKNQLITHIDGAYFYLQLLNYGPNPYEVPVGEYK
jgi:hypothetical protein